jgi:hypothetical protein
MRTFPDGFKTTIAAVALSSFVAGGVCAVTSSAATDLKPGTKISVDRTRKGDRLPDAAMHYQTSNNSSSTETATTSPHRPPLGCDPAFSPISAPSLAHIFKRCLV